MLAKKEEEEEEDHDEQDYEKRVRISLETIRSGNTLVFSSLFQISFAQGVGLEEEPGEEEEEEVGLEGDGGVAFALTGTYPGVDHHQQRLDM